MTCCSNWLLRLALCHGIFVGFTTIYIDIDRRLVKSYTSVKIFVYFKNLLYAFVMICYLMDSFDLGSFDNDSPVISFAFIATHASRSLLFVVVIMLRIKGDKALKKWLKILLVLQTEYFDKLPDTSVDKNIKNVLTLNIILVSANILGTTISLVPALIKGDFWSLMDVYLQSYLMDMQHYIMLHHGFILCYLNNLFSKLNNQLHSKRVEPCLASIYFQLTMLLQQVNVIYGPAIFTILLCLLLTISIFGYGIIIFMNLINYEIFIYQYLLTCSAMILLCIDMYLYFLICDRVYETSRETQRILLEFSTGQKNQEVESVCLGRLLLRHNINICGMFNVDLSSLFAMIAQIILYTIILIQIDYTKI
ncbi:putative gustatory receptor 22b [Calliphora vicina]|uniref:putative gustatory receptor 22b n=1 Tax=Calliphora vicina TaxID=7373 RepID=UPI00325AB1CE